MDHNCRLLVLNTAQYLVCSLEDFLQNLSVVRVFELVVVVGAGPSLVGGHRCVCDIIQLLVAAPDVMDVANVQKCEFTVLVVAIGATIFVSPALDLVHSGIEDGSGVKNLN